MSEDKGMTLDLDDLERKARTATQDEWQWRPRDHGVLEGKHDGQVVLWAPDGNEDTDEPALIVSVSDAAHIAAASPPVVLAMIARIRELEAGLLDAVDCDPNDLTASWRRDMRDLLNRGAVLS